MPSLHIGWSTWCALAIAHLAERRWVKALGIAYPFFTFIVIIGTGNHYVLDAVGGLVVLGAAFLVERLLLGRPVYAPPPKDGGSSSQDGDGNAGTSKNAGSAGNAADAENPGNAGNSAGKKPGLPQQPAFPTGENRRITV
jgi:hypothetical protein